MSKRLRVFIEVQGPSLLSLIVPISTTSTIKDLISEVKKKILKRLEKYTSFSENSVEKLSSLYFKQIKSGELFEVDLDDIVEDVVDPGSKQIFVVKSYHVDVSPSKFNSEKVF